jgi:hypothetical protein
MVGAPVREKKGVRIRTLTTSATGIPGSFDVD